MSQEPKITLDMIAKLPKWTQAHIAEIEGQRDEAIRALKKFSDNQTPSRIFMEDLVCHKKGGPEPYKIYIQAPRGEVTFDLDVDGQVRENQISVRIDREDPTQVLITAAWNQISMHPMASNMTALKGVRRKIQITGEPMKFRFLAVSTLSLFAAVAGFAQATPPTSPEPPKVAKSFNKVTIYVATYVNAPNDVAKNFLNPLVDKLEAEGATLLEGPAPVNSPNGFEFRIFLYSASDGTASFTVNMLAHTKGQVYPAYLGAGTALLDKDDEAEILDQFLASVVETFTNYVANTKPNTVQ